MGDIDRVLGKLFQPHKGILAADARPSSMDARLEEYGVSPGETNRSAYRELLFSTPNLERTISGVILSEETFTDHRTDDVSTRIYLSTLGIVPGVKVDKGLVPFDNGADASLCITTGLEDLSERCEQYVRDGAGFVKWRAKIPVLGATEPFLAAVGENLATYASIALKHNLVPIIEPEVLLSGTHTLEESAETLARTLAAVVSALRAQKCASQKCILKTSFATAGLERETLPADLVAEKTLAVLRESGLDNQRVFYGIVFLSGGLSSETAISYIQRIKAIAEQEGTEHSFTTPLTFSYARALQMPALLAWQGKEDQVLAAQLAFTQTLQHAIRTYKGREEAPLGSSGKVA